jgi:hypothetical protein
MAKSKMKHKRTPKSVLKFPDLEQSRSAVLNSLISPSSRRTYDHAIREFIEWYCSEPRLAFNKTVVTRYRISLEQQHHASTDKGEKDDLSEFKQTEYCEAVQKFQKFIVTEARNNGLSPERLGEAVHMALSTAKPKARYAVVPQRFKNWTLPRLLPARMLDAQLAKLLGLTKP